MLGYFEYTHYFSIFPSEITVTFLTRFYFLGLKTSYFLYGTERTNLRGDYRFIVAAYFRHLMTFRPPFLALHKIHKKLSTGRG